jgi:imidazoleglycerol-phosphate dehydratase / histidinol-phosphatase
MTKARRILFIDRDGTLITEPAEKQIDSFEKLEMVNDVIPALLRLRDSGYEFVMVSNQDGLGTASFPEADFVGPHRLLMQILESQGIRFSEVLIDPSMPSAPSAGRKPGIGMVMHYLKAGVLDTADSWVIGDRDTDLQLAENMGIGGLKFGPGHLSWPDITERLVTRPRLASLKRKTSETEIEVDVNLDSRPARFAANTGIGFFDHMLEQLSVHGNFSMAIRCKGDLHVDPHHTIEDVALAIGSTLDKALGDRRGIGRYGFLLAMDEAQADVAIDLSGRPSLVAVGEFTTDRIGEFPTEMVKHFFQSLSQTLRAAIHYTVRGENNHHKCEAIFKGVGRALRPALERTGRDLPSSKGLL